MNLKIDSPRKASLTEVLKEQQQARGIDPLALETDLLIKRILEGGFSGVFLKEAFISAYRMTPFNESLGHLIKLDAEAFRLFHQILHIRHVAGWRDDSLYEVKQLIKKTA
ncbi:MAG: hypothetical protein ABL903_20335 [Methylococcales bacterium]